MEYIIIAVSFFGIMFGADWLVSGSVSIAKRLKISEFVIGAAIVGIGTSMPEFVVSVIGAANGNADIAIGNVVGSNIFNVLGILGLTALFFPIVVDRTNMKFEIPFCIFVTLLLIALIFNFFNGDAPMLGRADGIILVCLFMVFMSYSFYRDRKKALKHELEHEPEHEPVHEEASPLWISLAKTVAGLAILAVSCDLFVSNAIKIAKSFGVNDAFISITLIACGTSLPELAASVTAALRKNTRLALGNIVGSNIFNITLILGITPVITPLQASGITAMDYFVMATAVLILPLISLRGKISRAAGLVLFLGFIAYNAHLLYSQIA
ncbi:MAG: calcium/sodium antiporter [Bacteroidales bacterium]|nr:calcium/sodium antiporter [Bacteroidales bacterium]